MADTFVRPAEPITQGITKLPSADQLVNYRLYVPLILCFKLDSNADSKKIFADLVAGLSRTLVELPFTAGRIVPEDDSSAWVQIVVGPDPGVTLKFKEHRIPEIKSSVCTFEELEQGHFAQSKLDSFQPAPKRTEDVDEPVLHLEANFIDGGLLLACCFHHSAFDASAWSRFLRVFSGHTNAATTGWTVVSSRFTSEALDRSPLFETPSNFKLEDCSELKVIEIPTSMPTPQNGTQTETPHNQDRYKEKLAMTGLPEQSAPVIGYWYFPAEKLRKLKAMAQSTCEADSWISTSDALLALIWRRSSAARGLLERGIESSTLWFPMNVRSRLGLHPDYMGNATYMAYTKFSMSELCSRYPDAQSRAATQIRAAINSIDANKVRGTFGLMASMGPRSVVYNVDLVSGADQCTTSLANYELYDLDWGCDLGKVTCGRYMLHFMMDGVVMVYPAFSDGSLEAAIVCSMEVLERLRVDKHFTDFAEFRCS
ncbi:hypothetical protein MMC30_000469 [Trapelia coarctata]|nr:hypothetical protein [Trapelia coarctata]